MKGSLEPFFMLVDQMVASRRQVPGLTNRQAGIAWSDADRQAGVNRQVLVTQDPP